MKLALLLISITVELAILIRMVSNGEIFPLGERMFWGAHLLTSIIVLVYVKHYEKQYGEKSPAYTKSSRLIRTLVGIQIFINPMMFITRFNPMGVDSYLTNEYLLAVRAFFTLDGARFYYAMISVITQNIFMTIALVSSTRLAYRVKAGKIAREGESTVTSGGDTGSDDETSKRVGVIKRINNILIRVSRANQLGMGIQRLLIVGWIFVPILLAFLFGDYGEEIISIWLVLFISYWVLVAIGMWVYKGFVVEQQNQN